MRRVLVIPLLVAACGEQSAPPPIEIPSVVSTAAPVSAPTSAPPVATVVEPRRAPVSVPAAVDTGPERPDGFVAARDWRRTGAKLATLGPDEALYDQGLQQELAGDLRRARMSFYELIQKHPSSPLIPYAYFAFGEMFFAEARSDPSKWDLADAAFKEVVKYAQTPLLAEGYARLGDVASNKGDGARAAMIYRKVLKDFPSSDAAKRVPRP